MSVDLTPRTADGYGVESSQELYTGTIFSVRADQVRMPDGSVARRDIVSHGGAVAIVALDADEQVVLISQYRHTARAYLWELPAGLLDAPGEAPLAAAQRELAEEVGLAAGQWSTLLDVRTSVGFSDEIVRVYLARDLREAGSSDFVQEGEEADLEIRRVPLDDCVGAVLAGAVENSLAVAGILGVRAALDRGPESLRPADLPWPGLER